MKIRSVTALARLSLPADEAQITHLASIAMAAREAFTAVGYEVQSVRLATDLFPTLAQIDDRDRRIAVVKELEATCQAAGFGYVALGPANAAMLPSVSDILANTEGIFATCHIVAPDSGMIDGTAIRGAAQVMLNAATLENGFGNLRFAALANVPPGTPFFPAAYWHRDAPALAIATESADLALDACNNAKDAADAHNSLKSLIEMHADRIQSVTRELAQAHDIAFHGIDFSLAPSPDPNASIGGALEKLTGAPVGTPGTLAAAAILTDAIHLARFIRAGFCGLMLPVLEDSVLAQRALEGYLTIAELLQWSSVCGTGLDTVPVPGDVSPQTITRLLFDVSVLAIRLQKPLTARLMPLPGKQAGDPVHFDFPFFADGGVLSLDQGAGMDGSITGPLAETQALSLSPYHDW